jgi:4-hydroxybenzoate polyprenyltransferase
VTAPTRARPALGLLVGCHPGPTLTVTVVVTALAASAGQSWPRLLWVALAVLAGQLAVGWCNDARDAGRDRAAGRTEKPTVRGWISARSLAVGAVLAFTFCVPLSYLGGGPIGGTAHVVAVISALGYDLWLKTTVLSVLPWALSFGLVPVFVTYGLQPPQQPAAWAVTVGVLLGVGAHLANSARDVAGDRLVGAEGIASALGPALARWLAVLALLGASTLLLFQLELSMSVAVAVVVLLAAGAGTGLRWRGGQRLFEVMLILAVIDVGLLVLAAGSIAQ